jgi:hypothetical protein
MDRSIDQRIRDSFHVPKSVVVKPEDKAEAREYSKSVYTIWQSVSGSLSRTVLLVFLLMALFELLVYQRIPTAISIGTFTLVNVPIIQIVLPTVVAFLLYDGSRLSVRWLRLELVYTELVKIYAPALEQNGLHYLLEPNLPSFWGVGAQSFEFAHTGNKSDAFIHQANRIVYTTMILIVPVAFECQAYYRLIQKFGYHNIFLWVNLVITILFGVCTALYTLFDRNDRAKRRRERQAARIDADHYR